MKFSKIAVLKGGLSAERTVSLASGKAVADALRRQNFNVTEIDVDRNLDIALRAAAPDAVFIALHGRYGEDGTVQGLLELLGIPYTGANVLSSALSLDKARTRDVVAAAGLKVAKGEVLTKENRLLRQDQISLPAVIKPVEEGSSVGVVIAHNQEAFQHGLDTAFTRSDRVLVEAFVAGREVQVAVLNGVAIGAVEIEPHAEFYDFDAKYKPGGSTHHIPPRIHAQTAARCNEIAQAVYAAVGCSGAARIDLIVPEQGEPTVLEINTIPGMTPTSLLPEIAQSAGISFDQLVTRILADAKTHIHP